MFAIIKVQGNTASIAKTDIKTENAAKGQRTRIGKKDNDSMFFIFPANAAESVVEGVNAGKLEIEGDHTTSQIVVKLVETVVPIPANIVEMLKDKREGIAASWKRVAEKLYGAASVAAVL